MNGHHTFYIMKKSSRREVNTALFSLEAEAWCCYLGIPVIPTWLKREVAYGDQTLRGSTLSGFATLDFSEP